MPKISSTGKQYTITIPKNIMKIMGWGKGDEVIISKYPEKELIYIEKITKKKNGK